MDGTTIAQVTPRRAAVAARIWWKALRPFAFPASIMPAIIGISLAWIKGCDLNVPLAVLTIAAAVAAHAGANLIQDYFDYTGGIDKPGTMGGSGLLVSGIIGPRSVFMGSIVCFAIAAFLAVPLIMHTGSILLWVVLAGFMLGAGYAVPGVGLKYRAMGDVAVFLAFGVGITLGSYLVQARAFDAAPLVCGISFGFLVVGILAANNMRDARDDANAGVSTVAVIMGEQASRALYIVLILAAYAVPIFYVQTGLVNAGALFILATIVFAHNLMRDVWRAPEGDRNAMAAAVGNTAKLSLFYGAAMTGGMIAWRLVTGV